MIEIKETKKEHHLHRKMMKKKGSQTLAIIPKSRINQKSELAREFPPTTTKVFTSFLGKVCKLSFYYMDEWKVHR